MGMVAQTQGPRRNGLPPVLNVTPLVDVALVILIIFMVIAPMLTKTFHLALPAEPTEDAPPPQDSDQPLVMTLDAEGVMRINQQTIAPEDLPDRLPRMLAATRHKVLHFDADDRLAYGDVVRSVDACRSAGARSIAIVTKRIEPR